jgi:hypothetical protein
LKNFLATGNSLELSLAEREVSFDLIFSSQRKPFCNVGNESELLSSISKLTKRFIDVNFGGENSTDIALQFSIDIVEVRPDWNILDILNFFKFIRQRQDLPENKIFGNKINSIKLMELTAVYEENKAIAREIWQKKQISETVFGCAENRLDASREIGQGDVIIDTRFRELANELNQKLNSERDKVYENAEKTKQYLKDKENNWNELMKKIANKELTEVEAISEHNRYCLEYK